MEKFHLFRLPVLPEVLLQCSETFKGARPDGAAGRRHPYSLANIVSSDPGLMLKILGSRDEPVDIAELNGTTLVGQLGEAGFTMLWSQAVLNDGLAQFNSQSLQFMRAQWAQSVRSSLLMRKISRLLEYEHSQAAAICGLLLTGGQLALAATEGDEYLTMITESESLEDCLFKEQVHFGSTHSELMAQILEQYHLPSLFCDAIKYQNEDPDAVESSPLLVRMAWLVRQLSVLRRLNPEIEIHAENLLGLSRGDLIESMEYADRGMEALADAWQLDDADPIYPPIRPVNPDVLRSRYVRTREKVLARSNAIALSCMLESTTEGRTVSNGGNKQSFIEQLTARGLRLFFDCQDFLLLRHDRSSRTLVPAGSTLHSDLTEELSFPCDPESTSRSIATRSFVKQESVCLTIDELQVVIDKQILKAFQCENLHTIPLEFEGQQVGLLLLGHQDHHPEDEGQQPELVNQFFYNLGSELKKFDKNNSQTVLEVEELLQDQNLRSLVHEVNNPLSIIKNYLQLLSIKQGDSTAISEEIDVIKSEIDRVSTILKDFRDKDKQPENKEVILNQVVEKIARIFRASLRQESGITIYTELQDYLPSLQCSEDKVRQILTNLVKNAVEAMDTGGKIFITTSHVIDMDGSRYQELTVTDTGPGIDPEILANLFRFGKSTKGDAHSGAGLAIVRKLTEELGGKISCQSSGKGTSFSLLLPAPDPNEND